MKKTNNLPFEIRKKGSSNEELLSSLSEKAKQVDLTDYIKSKIAFEKTNRTPYYLFDSFIRANSSSSLGNAETNGIPWTTESTSGQTVVWGIDNNSAYVVSRTGGNGIAYQDTKETDVLLEVDLSGVAGSNDGGIAFRIVDVNNFYQASVHGNNNSICLYKWVAGVKTEIIRFWDYTTIGDGKLSVLLRGNKIEVYLDGFLAIKQWDSFNNTATKHGLFLGSASLNYRWKHFSVKPVGNVPFKINETFDAPISKWYLAKEDANQSYSKTYDTNIKESGTSSLRVELRQSDTAFANTVRSEIKLPIEKPLEEHWYGASIFLPKDGVEDYAYDNSPEILMQWHHSPDTSLGELDISPEMALVTEKGNWKIWHRWDSGRVSTNATTNLNIKDLGSYSQDKGKWVQWVFHIKWGYLDVHEPITEVFKDGVMVYSSKNPNTYNNQNGVYPKFGIYKWDYKDNFITPLVSKRIVYFDNYWVK